MSERVLELPITRVTVFEDRAEVVREVTLDQAAADASEVLVASGLTPLLAEERVVASLEGEGEAHVDDVVIEHRWIAADGAEQERFRDLEARQRAAEQAFTEAHDSLAEARQRQESLGELMGRFADEVAKTVARGDGVPEVWQQGFAAFEEKLDAIGVEQAEAEAREEAAGREAEELRGLLTAAMERRQRYVADLLLRVSGETEGARLRVSATVPCALWRPSHEAHLRADGSVEWTVYADVWQRTGEPWNDVELVLSTARPSAGAELPRLRPDLLRLCEKSPEERKKVVIEHRFEAVPREDLSGAAPGVYDGGEPRRLASPGRVSVPENGRPHRVAVASFTSPAAVDRVAMPELSPHVFLRARLRNRAGGPLLAGPVTLLVDGAHVGIGDVPYVGPDEDFDLSFGSDDRFVVHGRKRRKLDRRRIGKDRFCFVSEAELAYLGEGEEEVKVLMRLPKSEAGQLCVVPNEKYCAPWPVEEDEHGIVSTPLVLRAGVRESVLLGFSFETSGDVEVPDPW